MLEPFLLTMYTFDTSVSANPLSYIVGRFLSTWSNRVIIHWNLEYKMTSQEKGIARLQFRLRIHESEGQAYENLFVRVMGFCEPDFKAKETERMMAISLAKESTIKFLLPKIRTIQQRKPKR
jgi:hypothetical protein